MLRELLCIWTDWKSLNGWNFLKDMLFRETVLVEISETASRVNSQLITRARMRREETGALSIQQKIPVWNFGNFTSSMERYIPVAQTRPKPPRVLFVPSQQTQNLYPLKEKSKYCLYPKEHSTVQKGRWKTKGGGILFCVESLWKQVKVKNSRELTAPEIP